MIIELAKIEQLKEINKLAKQVHDIHVELRPDIFKTEDEMISNERLESLILNNEIFIAKDEEKVIGYAIISIKERIGVIGMHDRKVIDLEAICVDEKYRGKGVGRKIIKYLIEYGKQKGCTDFYLNVYKDNLKARKFYEDLGMKVRNINYSMKIK